METKNHIKEEFVGLINLGLQQLKELQYKITAGQRPADWTLPIQSTAEELLTIRTKTLNSTLKLPSQYSEKKPHLSLARGVSEWCNDQETFFDTAYAINRKYKEL